MNWGDVLWELTWPPLYTFAIAAGCHFWARQPWREAMKPWLTRWLAACTGGIIGSLMPPWSVQQAMAFAVLAAGGAAVWFWLRRKRRDRARKLAGAKSRALVAALVRKVREAARPRPVLRPQPGRAA